MLEALVTLRHKSLQSERIHNVHWRYGGSNQAATTPKFPKRRLNQNQGTL